MLHSLIPMTQTQQPLPLITSPVSLRQFKGSMEESDELLQNIVTVFQEICAVDYCLLLLLEKTEIYKIYLTSESNLKQENLIDFSRVLYQQNQVYLEQGKIFFLVIQDGLISVKLKKERSNYRFNQFV